MCMRGEIRGFCRQQRWRSCYTMERLWQCVLAPSRHQRRWRNGDDFSLFLRRKWVVWRMKHSPALSFSREMTSSSAFALTSFHTDFICPNNWTKSPERKSMQRTSLGHTLAFWRSIARCILFFSLFLTIFYCEFRRCTIVPSHSRVFLCNFSLNKSSNFLIAHSVFCGGEMNWDCCKIIAKTEEGGVFFPKVQNCEIIESFDGNGNF